MKKYIKVSMRFKVGELIEQGIEKKKLGKYSFLPLPSNPKNEFKTEFLLKFKDTWEEKQQFSNPEQEGRIILSWLSVILKQKLKADFSRLNNLQISNTQKEVIDFESPINFPINLDDLYIKFRSLPLETLEKYVRSCECYQEALLLSNKNPTISFFLLVVCIECLSSKNSDFYEYLMRRIQGENISKKDIINTNKEFIDEYGLKNNFIEFILSHFNTWKESFSKEEFRTLLSSVYKIRSLFTHEGENLEKYIRAIDNNLKSKSVSMRIKDKNIEFPGLNHFSKIVRSVLIDFLERRKDGDTDNLPKLAIKDSLVNFILKEDKSAIKKGSFVTKSQIKYKD